MDGISSDIFYELYILSSADASPKYIWFMLCSSLFSLSYWWFDLCQHEICSWLRLPRLDGSLYGLSVRKKPSFLYLPAAAAAIHPSHSTPYSNILWQASSLCCLRCSLKMGTSVGSRWWRFTIYAPPVFLSAGRYMSTGGVPHVPDTAPCAEGEGERRNTADHTD